jgi:gentisate 1,2-dioxygenase
MTSAPQISPAPDRRYTERGCFVSVEDGFNIKRASLAAHAFAAERESAFAAAAPTGLVALDRSSSLGVVWPATTPMMLARYIRLRAGEALRACFACGGAIHVVLAGSGEWLAGDDHFAWQRGDVFILPGGIDSTYRAASDSVVYCVTNEPLYAFEAMAVGAASQVEPVLYPAARIAAEIDRLASKIMLPATPGRAFNLSSAALAAERTALRSLTGTFNLVMPGERQRSHRHCATALVLVLQGGGCRSTIGGTRFDWQADTVILTPPLDAHSHENPGDEPALAFIVQDGAWHYYARTMDFSFTE